MHQFTIFAALSTTFGLILAAPSNSRACSPFYSTFSPSDISASASAPFIPISAADSYAVGDDGLRMYLDRPHGKIRTKDGENDKIAEGATINSTFTLLHGKVTFEIAAPAVPGVITAAILIADEQDEIDVEILGGDATNYQTNVFAPQKADGGAPLYGVFASVQPVAGSVTELHNYTIDWDEERIVWGVDGEDKFTLRRDETVKNGVRHYPVHRARVQLGIWDASSPAGTAEWGKGPIRWESGPERMWAVVRSVRVEC